MINLPTGTVTFLFTDIEGSTKLAQSYPDTWESLQKRHHAILQSAIEAHAGYVFQIIGDAFCAAFHTAGDALYAALDAQCGLQHEAWYAAPVKVRMGIHTGAAQAGAIEDRAGDYVGYLTLTRVQRVMSVAHGGQVLLSNPTAELVRGDLPANVTLRDMGEHRLKSLVDLEHLWQMVAPDLVADFPPLQSLNAIPNNLPTQLTSFIGREEELARIQDKLTDSRLITLTGSGGVGKTRLSLQIAAKVIADFAQGVWFVELAPLTDSALIPSAIASIFGLSEQTGRPVMTVLIDYLRAKSILLLLDNCEHLIDACAKFADTILHIAPHIKILATSREALGIAGEIAYRVPSLSMPPLPIPAFTPDVQTLNQYEAVRLFIDRALAVQPDFSVTNANAPAMAQICHRLDGIPLALELAAARVKALSLEQIAMRLDDRFRLLTGGSRTALPRHQTLRAAIDWSHSLLTDEERVLFRRLSVFPGGCTLDAAQAVCICDPICPEEVFDLLARLVDKSLIIFEQRDSETRYRLMETIRQYARDKLLDSEEGDAIRDRHLDYFLKLAEQAEPSLIIGDPGWLYRIETEYDNFHAALEHATSRNTESALRLDKALSWFWDYSNRGDEGFSWGKRLLDVTMNLEAGKWRATALWLAGAHATAGESDSTRIWLEAAQVMARKIGDKYLVMCVAHELAAWHYFWGKWVEMRPYAEEGLAISRELNVTWEIANALWQLGTAALGDGNIVLARSLYEQSLEIARKAKMLNTIAFALGSLARLARLDGDYAKAENLYLECVQIRRVERFRGGLADALANLAQVALLKSDPGRARALFVESFALWRELGNVEWQIESLIGFAGVAGMSYKSEQAAKLFGAAEVLFEGINSEMDPLDHQVYDPIIETVRKQLGESRFNVEWAEGRAMSLEQAIELALKAIEDVKRDAG